MSSSSTSAGRHFHVGSNLSGYLPEGDVLCFLEWSDAAEQVAAHAREIADSFDDETWQELQSVPASDYGTHEDGSPDYGDDAPSERAAVDAVLTDDGPRDGQEWATVVTDPRGWGHVVWLAVVPDEDCDHEGCEHDEDPSSSD